MTTEFPTIEELEIKLARYQAADKIVATAHNGNKRVVETTDFLAGVKYTREYYTELLAKIKSLLDDEFQTKDELVPPMICEIYDLLETSIED